MRLLPASQPLRARALCALRGAARFGSASLFSSSASPAAAFDPSSALERQRERRRKERAEPQPTIGIEGTTEFYTRQLVVVDPDASAPVTWAKKIEFSDHVVASYVKALVATGGSPKSSPLRTIAATPFPGPCASTSEQVPEEDVATRKHDLLVFPDNIRVHDVELSHIPSLVTKLVEPNPNVHGVLADLNLSSAPLAKGHHILVCAHESRDERCGCNGPKLLRWLQDVGAQRNVPVHLYSSSHFGGHRYAANCIAYPSGDWFGLLNEPNDAAALISALEDKEPLRLHAQWRGRIALTKDEQILTLRNAVAAVETSQ